MTEERAKFLRSLYLPIGLVIIIWIVEIFEVFGGHRFTLLGIYPRDPSTLTGILTAPFIHSDWGHLISNSLPIFALSLMMTNFYKKLVVPTYAGLFLLTGGLVWLFARPSYHIGISGIVYGLISFIFWSGLFRENIRAIILSLVILIAYSGYFQGLTPEDGMSWESHLFGALSGLFLGFLYKNIEIEELKDEKEKIPQEVDIKTPFFAHDTFQFTKEERYLRSLHEEE